MIDVEELAKSLNKTKRHIYYIMAGRRTASLEFAKELEKVTGVPRLSWLYPDEYHNPYVKKKEHTA